MCFTVDGLFSNELLLLPLGEFKLLEPLRDFGEISGEANAPAMVDSSISHFTVYILDVDILFSALVGLPD